MPHTTTRSLRRFGHEVERDHVAKSYYLPTIAFSAAMFAATRCRLQPHEVIEEHYCCHARDSEERRAGGRKRQLLAEEMRRVDAAGSLLAAAFRWRFPAEGFSLFLILPLQANMPATIAPSATGASRRICDGFASRIARDARRGAAREIRDRFSRITFSRRDDD